MPSPICEVKVGAGAYGPTTYGIDSPSSTVVVIRLVSQADVRTWECSCITTDDLSNSATINAGLVIDALAKTATFTTPLGLGRVYRFRSRINGGVDPNGIATPSYSTTFAIYVLTSGGVRCIAVDETTEGDPIFGWVAPLNELLRNPTGGGGGTPGDPNKSVQWNNVGVFAGETYWTRESSGRFHVAYKVMTGAPALTFASAGDTITRASGSWLTDGFAIGDPIVIRDTVSNNLATTVSNVTASVLTVSGALVDESVGSSDGYIEGGGTLTIGKNAGVQPKMGAIRILPPTPGGAPYYEQVVIAGLIDSGAFYGPGFSVPILSWSFLGDLMFGGTFTASNQVAGNVERPRFIGLWADRLKDYSHGRDWVDDAGTFTLYKEERRATLTTTNATPTAFYTFEAASLNLAEFVVVARSTSGGHTGIWKFMVPSNTSTDRAPIFVRKSAGAVAWDCTFNGATVTVTGFATPNVVWQLVSTRVVAG